jgi:uncharacterized protein
MEDNIQLLTENFTNPALLFFVLGILAVRLKSDLEIPANSSKFISLYLLFAIGFKGGQELSHSTFHPEMGWTFAYGIGSSIVIPFYLFFLLKRKMSNANAGAIAASYGSVSAVTFVTAASYLENHDMHFNGHLVAVMALMEAPAIIVAVILMRLFQHEQNGPNSLKKVIHHSLTNGSVLLIIGSLLIGYFSNAREAEGIKPFTTDLFKGFLAIFLLDMGISSGKKLEDFFKSGWFTLAIAILIPLINGLITAYLSGFITQESGDRFMLSILAASASYIAVPAAMKIAAPEANPGIFIPMALAITFPINITIGFPIYLTIIESVSF